MMPPSVVPWPPRNFVAEWTTIVRAERDDLDPVGRAERVVDDERQAVAVGDGGNGLDVRDVAVRVAQRLEIDGARVRLDGRLDRCGVVRVHERRRDAVLRQRVRQQVIGAAVDRLLRDNVVALPRKRLNGIGDGRCAGGSGQSGHAALKGCHALLEHVLRGVRQAAVDVARVRQAEAGRSLCAVTEYIGRRLVDGHGARAGGGIGLLLSDVKLQGLKMIAHGDVSFVILSDYMDGIFPSAGISATKKAGAENSSRSEKRSWSAAPHSRHAPRMAARPASSSAREPSIRSAAKNIAATSLRLMDAS